MDKKIEDVEPTENKEEISPIKAFINENKEKIKQYANIVIFSFVLFFWTYLTSGNVLVSVLAVGIGIWALLSERLIVSKNKPAFKALFSIAFAALLIALFVIAEKMSSLSLFISTPVVITCLILYFSFKKSEKKLEWIFGAFVPVFTVLIIEFLQSNIRRFFWNIYYNESCRFIVAISLWLTVFVIYFFVHLFNNKRVGYCIGVGIFAIFGITNFFVLEITDQPFVFSDFKIATTAMGVIQEQTISPKAIVRLIFGLLFFAALFTLIILIFKKGFDKKRILKRVSIIICSALVLPLIVSFSSFLYNTVLLYMGHTKYGFVGNFFLTLDTKIKFPDDIENYLIEDKNDEGDYKPNVIVVMNEAFSDLGSEFDLSLNKDPLEYFHSLQKNYPGGIVYSSVRGNNTCSSEWEFLSGSPTGLTKKGAVIYQDNAIPMRSLVSLFNSRGYETVGLHPYYSYGYNRSSMYKELGFDQTYFLEDLPKGMGTVRGFVTDSENYGELIRLYEENKANGDKPFFCFNITMQNHGGYQTNHHNDIVAKGMEDNLELSTYLSMINRSDDALKELLDYFSSVEEDTIILFFGDHQPMISTDFYADIFGKEYSDLSLEELSHVYSIPYLIWSNCELNESAAPKETSMCYLSNILFEVASIPKSTWLNMVDEYQEAYPVITDIFTKNSKGEIFETKTLLNQVGEKDILNIYKKYSYGILYGTKKR